MKYANFYHFINIFLQKILSVQKKVLPLHSLNKNTNYGARSSVG